METPQIGRRRTAHAQPVRARLGHLATPLSAQCVCVTLLELVLLVILATPCAHAQSVATVAAAIRVEVENQQPDPYIRGSVTNNSDYRIGGVRLRVDSSDAAGRPLDPTFGWVYGDIPGRGGRVSFRVPASRNAVTCSVSIVSFDLISPQGP
jgi:hypothetical protein